MLVQISYKKNHEGILGKEWEETYDEYDIEFLKKMLYEIVSEYDIGLAVNGLDLSQDDWEKIEDVQHLRNGTYDFDMGDFTYYIEIRGNEK